MSDALLTKSTEVFSKRASTFSLAAKLLTPAQREQSALLYGFCRLVDDIADECEDARLADEELYDLRQQVLGLREARSEVAAAMSILDGTGVGRTPALHLIDGAADDVGGHIVRNDRALRNYCYQVAGTVGLMMCPVIGVTDPDAHRFAVELGIGMQITNLCRDVLEDSQNERIYLPRTRLEAAGTSPEALLAQDFDREATARVVLELLDVADRYYERGWQGLRFIPWRPRIAIAVAARVYQAISGVLRSRAGDALQGRAYLGWGSRLWHAAKAIGELAWRGSAPRQLDGDVRLLPG